MAHHTRSNSLPSNGHPAVEDFEDHLIRLKSSAEATSSSASCVSKNLESVNNLHESINDLIQLSSMKQGLALEQGRNATLVLLDGSLRLLDCCGIAKDITARKGICSRARILFKEAGTQYSCLYGIRKLRQLLLNPQVCDAAKGKLKTQKLLTCSNLPVQDKHKLRCIKKNKFRTLTF
ncbi:UNVERIFIED_CONTAM: hypothetical protein Sradi_5166700 [Sesamum radiatum]|uniref:Uncharacterized protein n=1 Tax=Sesamum radiatum TaxID=300843 RepID=A0AAW2M530_SESRA